jgi:CheY-like chemotaxis protein
MSLRILVVDDCPDMRLTMRLLLRSWGHEVCEAPDGPTALKAASEFLPDVVLLDLGLPGMDGCEVARRLRASGFRDALLLAVSGFGNARDVARCLEAGFDAHLLKPVELTHLRGLIEERTVAVASSTIPAEL